MFIDIPLHPTLFFSLSIILGLVFSYFFMLADLIDKKDKKFIIVNIFLYGSWICAVGFILYVYKQFDPTNPTLAAALAPFGVTIAAFVASASVMKNIAETKAHDLGKSEKEKERKRIFALNVMITIHTTIDVFITKHINDQDDMTHSDLVENSQVIQKMLDLIFIDDVLPYLKEDQQNSLSNIYTQFCDFTVKYIHISPTADYVTWPYYAIDKYNHFKIFSEEYIELSKLK